MQEEANSTEPRDPGEPNPVEAEAERAGATGEDQRTQTARVPGGKASAGVGPASAAEPTRPFGSFGMDLLEDIELEATLQFGSREMLLREVLELGPGDVIELDRHVSEPVDLVVGDRIVARGEVVVASGNFALRITEVATPQLRLESIRCLF